MSVLTQLLGFAPSNSKCIHQSCKIQASGAAQGYPRVTPHQQLRLVVQKQAHGRELGHGTPVASVELSFSLAQRTAVLLLEEWRDMMLLHLLTRRARVARLLDAMRRVF